MCLAESNLFEVLEAAEHAPTAWSSAEQLRDVQRAFRGWLSEFRMFCDSTAHWISKKYGKAGEEFAAFRDTLRQEHAANLGYRVCDAVRNISLHVGEVINDACVYEHELPTGEAERVVQLGIDCSKLLADPSVALRNANVRRELEALDASLDLEACIGVTSLSCRRALLMLASATSSELEAAALRCLGLEAEVFEFDAEASPALLSDFYDLKPVDLKSLDLRPGGWDEARSAMTMLRNAGEVNREPHAYGLDDLRMRP